MTGRNDIGARLREWRVRRKLTQVELAKDSSISTRHLSFVETGRSRPSRDLVLRLAQRLELPLRERNSFILDVRGGAPLIANYWQWRAHLLANLARQVLASNDAALADLHRDLQAYPPPPGAGPDDSVAGLESAAGGSFAVPFRLRTPGGVLSFFSTTTVFGTPIEVTLSEISLECFYPADAATAAILHARRTGSGLEGP